MHELVKSHFSQFHGSLMPRLKRTTLLSMFGSQQTQCVFMPFMPIANLKGTTSTCQNWKLQASYHYYATWRKWTLFYNNKPFLHVDKELTGESPDSGSEVRAGGIHEDWILHGHKSGTINPHQFLGPQSRHKICLVAQLNYYSLHFKIKVTFGHKFHYEIKVSFGEVSLKLRQIYCNVAINNVNVVANGLPS
jgi:hypothetical protein